MLGRVIIYWNNKRKIVFKLSFSYHLWSFTQNFDFIVIEKQAFIYKCAAVAQSG